MNEHEVERILVKYVGVRLQGYDDYKNLGDFFEYFSEMLIADLRSGMKLLENNPKLQKEIAKELDVANPLYNKIEEKDDDGWYFKEEEGQNIRI